MGRAGDLEGAAAADAWLDAKGVAYTVIEQDKATGKCRDSAAERGVSLKQIVKSLVFADPEGRFVHCLLPGHLQVDEKKLAAVAGGECTMLESDALLETTGARVGEVHPFVRGVTRRLLDRRVTLNSVVSFNTGDMTKGLVVELAGFMKALEGQVSVHDIARGEDGEEVDDLAAELGVPRHDAKFLLETEGALGYYTAWLLEYTCCREADVNGDGARAAAVVEEASDPLFWVRAVVRFASQDKADWRVVPPAWLAALAAANKATRFARETALKEYLRDPSLPPAVPAPAQIPADGDSSLGDALGALVDEILEENGNAIAKLGGDSQRRGKLEAFLMGAAMKRSAGRYPPGAVREALLAALASTLASLT